MLFIDSGEFGCRGWGCVKGHAAASDERFSGTT
jgi:hypothetical protein